MIKVAYDLTSLAVSPFGGIARVCHHTIMQAEKSNKVTATGVYRRGDPKNIDVSGSEIKRLRWFDSFQTSPFDIIHALGHRIPPMKGKRLVYTLYDSWSLHPNRYQPAGFQKKVGARMIHELQKADAIIAISETSRSSLLQLGIVEPSKCHVARIGVSKADIHTDAPASDMITQVLKAPFALFVGRIEVRKNLEHIIEAVSQILSLNLVIVGEPGFGYEQIERKTLSKFPQDRLFCYRHLSDVDLDILYHKAVCTILPSWEEGFGLPILEAMVRGCPVITSNCSASAEVGSDGAILVDPEKPNQSRDAISKLIESKEYRNRMSIAAISRTDDFSWERYFDQLTRIYDSVLSSE